MKQLKLFFLLMVAAPHLAMFGADRHSSAQPSAQLGIAADLTSPESESKTPHSPISLPQQLQLPDEEPATGMQSPPPSIQFEAGIDSLSEEVQADIASFAELLKTYKPESETTMTMGVSLLAGLGITTSLVRFGAPYLQGVNHKIRGLLAVLTGISGGLGVRSLLRSIARAQQITQPEQQFQALVAKLRTSCELQNEDCRTKNGQLLELLSAAKKRLEESTPKTSDDHEPFSLKNGAELAEIISDLHQALGARIDQVQKTVQHGNDLTSSSSTQTTSLIRKLGDSANYTAQGMFKQLLILQQLHPAEFQKATAIVARSEQPHRSINSSSSAAASSSASNFAPRPPLHLRNNTGNQGINI